MTDEEHPLAQPKLRSDEEVIDLAAMALYAYIEEAGLEVDPLVLKVFNFLRDHEEVMRVWRKYGELIDARDLGSTTARSRESRLADQAAALAFLDEIQGSKGPMPQGSSSQRVPGTSLVVPGPTGSGQLQRLGGHESTCSHGSQGRTRLLGGSQD
jgi:hypothetical protein